MNRNLESRIGTLEAQAMPMRIAARASETMARIMETGQLVAIDSLGTRDIVVEIYDGDGEYLSDFEGI